MRLNACFSTMLLEIVYRSSLIIIGCLHAALSSGPSQLFSVSVGNIEKLGMGLGTRPVYMYRTMVYGKALSVQPLMICINLVILLYSN